MTSQTKYFILVVVSVGLLFGTLGCIFGTPGSSKPSAVVGGGVSGPPDWATCAISLEKVRGSAEQSLAGARQSLQRIQNQTGWQDLHILQTEQLSIVCRGYFKSFTDDKAQRTRDQVRNYRDLQGEKPFEKAFFVDLPHEKKKLIIAGPAKWDVRRAGGNASLCIGYFIDDELCKDRLTAAVKKVESLRKQGVEAWYYHGQDRSGVYVGHFNADWEWVGAGKTMGGKVINRQQLVTHDPQYDILRKKFPKYAENGQVQGYMVGKNVVYEASMLVIVPRFDQEITDAEAGLH